MSKTNLIIPIDTATLVDAVKNTDFSLQEKLELIDILTGQSDNTTSNTLTPSRNLIVKLWLGLNLITFLQNIEPKSKEVNKLIADAQSALDIL